MTDKYILLVDDDHELLDVYKKILTIKGFNIITADNGIDALKIIKEKEIYVVILDILMPKMDGIQVLERIKEMHTDLEVIMLTAEGSISGAVESIKKGAYTYIVKPANIDDLINTIRKVTEIVNMRYENSLLKEHIVEITKDYKFVGRGNIAKRLREEAATVGATQATVLITGESGTGKEVLARLIHQASDRSNNPFVSINCAAFNENLIESELFGAEKGAYTGADRQRKGRFEIANGGTIFFDEIGELSLNMQAKLLRVLQEKEFERVGGNTQIHSDFRVISATNVDLKKAVELGNFRQDLYYRINIIPIEIPPLRERYEDIQPIAEFFLTKISREMKKKIAPLSSEVIKSLEEYAWPGNIRELRNVIERLVVMAKDETITISDLPEEFKVQSDDNKAIKNAELRTAKQGFEKDFITEVMRRNNWNITKAAKELNISRKTLYKRLNDYNIQ